MGSIDADIKVYVQAFILYKYRRHAIYNQTGETWRIWQYNQSTEFRI